MWGKAHCSMVVLSRAATKSVLKAIAVGVMVVDVVGGYEAYAQVMGQPHRFLHKVGVSFQEVALKLYVYRAGPEPLHVVFEQDSGFSPDDRPVSSFELQAPLDPP